MARYATDAGGSREAQKTAGVTTSLRRAAPAAASPSLLCPVRSDRRARRAAARSRVPNTSETRNSTTNRNARICAMYPASPATPVKPNIAAISRDDRGKPKPNVTWSLPPLFVARKGGVVATRSAKTSQSNWRARGRRPGPRSNDRRDTNYAEQLADRCVSADTEAHAGSMTLLRWVPSGESRARPGETPARPNMPPAASSGVRVERARDRPKRSALAADLEEGRPKRAWGAVARMRSASSAGPVVYRLVHQPQEVAGGQGVRAIPPWRGLLSHGWKMGQVTRRASARTCTAWS